MATLTKLLFYLLSSVGAVTLTTLLVQLTRFLALYARPSSLPRYKHAGRASWALVTGATDGIGRALAEELCLHGFCVLLHGRSRSKLESTRDEIQRSVPGARLDTVLADATDCLDQDIARIRERVEALTSAGEGEAAKLTVLVNNVGGLNYEPRFQDFDEMDGDDIDRTMNLNARFPTKMTHALMPLLKRNQPSLVMNVGSMTGVTGTPYLAVYCASKAYTNIFSATLTTECEIENPGVEVLGLLVGAVKTNKLQVEENMFTPNARTFAKAALQRVGCGKRVVNAYFWHAVQASLLTVLPENTIQNFVKKVLKEKKEEECRNGKEFQ